MTVPAARTLGPVRIVPIDGEGRDVRPGKALGAQALAYLALCVPDTSERSWGLYVLVPVAGQLGLGWPAFDNAFNTLEEILQRQYT